MTDTPATEQPKSVACPTARDPIVRRFILTAMCIGFGLYCAYDLLLTDEYPYAAPAKDINKFGKWAFNVGGAAILTPLGLAALASGICLSRRRLVADPEGIGYAGRKKVLWSRFRPIDPAARNKFQKKGILYLHYDGDKRLKLDSYKLQNFKALVALVESHLGPAGQGEE